jgi:UDP-glucose 4-epimerase
MPDVVWITGARGFIGRHLCNAVVLTGDTVVALGNASSKTSAITAATALNGPLNAAMFDRAFDLHGAPDRIYHLAGGSSVGASLADPEADKTRTVGGTAALLDWLNRREIPTHLIVASSAAVYGAGHDSPVAEYAETRPFSPYGVHKFMMEGHCRDAACDALGITIARLFSVYGPGLRKQLLWDLCNRIAAGENPVTLGGTGNERRDWTHVSDVVRLLVHLGTRPASGYAMINGATGVGTPVSAIARLVTQAWKTEGPGIRFSGISRPGDPEHLVADSVALAALGFEWTIPVNSGIADYVAWYRSNQQ